MALTKNDQQDIANIQDIYYMKPPLSMLDKFIKDSKKPYKQAIKEAFNYIHTFMISSMDYSGKIQQARLARGEIRDIKQANKAIAGNMFPNMLRFIFLKNKEAGNIKVRICRYFVLLRLISIMRLTILNRKECLNFLTKLLLQNLTLKRNLLVSYQNFQLLLQRLSHEI